MSRENHGAAYLSMLVTAAGTSGSRLLGLVRDQLIAGFFGTGGFAAAFIIAFQIPNLFRRLLGEGALTAALMPVMTQERKLGGNARVLCAMRCGEPGLEAAARELRAAGARDVLAIPLFPQRAESSWDSAAERAKEVFRKRAPQIRLRFAAPFFAEPGYVGALAETTENALRGRAFDKLLISFHGVPAAAKRAESYRAECLTTAEKLAAALRLPRERWEAAFQSRFGRGKWIGPATDARLRALPAEGARRLAVVSPSFVADCLESLEEIGVAGRGLFLAAGGESFCAVPCLNASPAFARFLSEIVRSRAAA